MRRSGGARSLGQQTTPPRICHTACTRASSLPRHERVAPHLYHARVAPPTHVPETTTDLPHEAIEESPVDAHAVFTCYSHAFFNALSQMLSIGYG